MKVDVAVMRNVVVIFEILFEGWIRGKVWCLKVVPHQGCAVLSLYSRTM